MLAMGQCGLRFPDDMGEAGGGDFHASDNQTAIATMGLAGGLPRTPSRY